MSHAFKYLDPSISHGADTFVELLRMRAAESGDDRAFRFLIDGEAEEVSWTFADLDTRARAIAAGLQARGRAGERLLLLYPPGLDFIAAFFGTLYAGAIAVPALPPDPRRPEPGMARLRGITRDAGVAEVLSVSALEPLRPHFAQLAPEITALPCTSTDVLDAGEASGWRETLPDPGALAFLQYTSGSTSEPKGVMVDHANLLYNTSLICETLDLAGEPGCSWLPTSHDMGLIGGVLTPVVMASEVTLLSPLSFLRRPIRWLRALSRSGATATAGPNFAYELCVRRSTPEEREGLDLRRWRVAFIGAEPIRPETLDAFVRTFEPYGFRAEAFYPCYGMAETTLIASGGRHEAPPRVFQVPRDQLEGDGAPGVRELVGCGRALGDHRIVIADPERCEPCADGDVGEIWIAGSSVTQGYWDRPELSREVFGARLANGDPTRFFRTGDLGSVRDGELVICGRRKDLIILNGRNIAPEDLEFTAERCCPEIVAGSGAAFAVDLEDGERAVIVFELAEAHRDAHEEVAERIADAIAAENGVPLHEVVLVEPRSVPKTPSGKIQRFRCREAWQRRTLERVA